MQQEPVLITGGAGFIGTNVARSFLARGQRVLIFDRLSRPGVEDNVRAVLEDFPQQCELVQADLRDREAVQEAVDRASLVCHFAAQVAVTTSLDNPREDFEVNALGTLNLLESLRLRKERCGHGVPLLFTSTNKVYGALDDVDLCVRGRQYVPQQEPTATHGISEARPLDFHSPYGCSKGAADQYVLDYARTYGLEHVVFRMSCIYGPHQKGNEDQGWVAHFLLKALANEPITLYGDGCQVRDVLFVDDLVNAFHLALANLERISGRPFNLGGGPANAVSLLQVVEEIGRLHGTEPELQWGDWRVGDQRYYVSDTRSFAKATGWKPQVTPAQGIARLFDWLRENQSVDASREALAV